MGFLEISNIHMCVNIFIYIYYKIKNYKINMYFFFFR